MHWAAESAAGQTAPAKPPRRTGRRCPRAAYPCRIRLRLRKDGAHRPRKQRFVDALHVIAIEETKPLQIFHSEKFPEILQKRRRLVCKSFFFFYIDTIYHFCDFSSFPFPHFRASSARLPISLRKRRFQNAPSLFLRMRYPPLPAAFSPWKRRRGHDRRSSKARRPAF